jgi:Transposase DDE domain group 1
MWSITTRCAHDPIMAVLAGKLTARRKNCAAVAGKSTLNRLELGKAEPTPYHKIGHDPLSIEAAFVDLFLEAQRRAPPQIILDLDATDDPLHGHQEGRFFHGYYDCYCYLPLYIFCGRHLLAAKLRRSNIDASAGQSPRWRGSSPRSAYAGRGCASYCGLIRGLPARH